MLQSEYKNQLKYAATIINNINEFNFSVSKCDEIFNLSKKQNF